MPLNPYKRTVPRAVVEMGNDRELNRYRLLMSKLAREGLTLHQFFNASAQEYLEESER